MALTVMWSSRAIGHYDQVLVYLSSVWGKTVVRDFINKVDKKVTSISTHPGIGRRSEQRAGVRGTVIVAQNVLYYETHEEMIKIQALQNPAQNPFR